MKRIAVLTSGGDAPCMNAAIKSVVRTDEGQLKALNMALQLPNRATLIILFILFIHE